VKVEDENNTYVDGCNGYATIQDINGGNQVNFKSYQHDKPLRYSRTGGDIKKSKARVEYHGDDTIDYLASKVGTWVRWSKYSKCADCSVAK